MKLFALPLFLLLSSCCEKAEPENPKQEFSFTVVSGELPTPPGRFRKVSEAVYQLIKQEDNPVFQKYTETIPTSKNATIEFIPIRGGEFTMGSSTDVPHPDPDELPAHRVQVDSFWMASTETTWAMYQNFLQQRDDKGRYLLRDEFGFIEDLDDQVDIDTIDSISGPSAPYLPAQSGPISSNLEEPATGMTRHSALKFCQWLTAQTGHYYRLPTEAEWEYACRAGSTTAYSFGNNPKHLREFGLYYTKDSDSVYPAPIASHKQNPWGLYDMHGNVCEWTLDAYSEYPASRNTIKNPISFAAKLHQGVVRGGSFDHAPEELRSTSRFPASRDWNDQDPRSPPSIWYNSSAFWLGFRIVRPLKTPSLEEAHLIWNIDSGKFWNW